MNFTHLVATFGYWAVLVFVAIQCAGIPFPGGAVLLAAAIYAGTTHQLEVAPIILAAAVGSILGNLLGYVLGSRGGYRLLVRYGHFVRLDERKIKLGQYLYLRHGGLIVVLGRFVSVSRTLEAFLAGVNKMGWVRFLLFTVVGGVIWATVIGLGAYYLGDSLHRPTGPLGIALTVLVLCLFAICIRILLRNIRRLEDIAERMLPGPLDMGAGKKKQEAEQDH
jgi:membrane protein DedA with SNARE-associated domain